MNTWYNSEVALILSAIFGIVLAYFWEYFCTHIIKKKELRLFGWRLHHSIYGIIFVVVGLFNQNIINIGIGVGILIQHTFTDGFRFISKE